MPRKGRPDRGVGTIKAYVQAAITVEQAVHLERQAESRGVTVAEYLRRLIDKDMKKGDTL